MTAFATLASESTGRAQGFLVPRFEISIDGVRLANQVLRDVRIQILGPQHLRRRRRLACPCRRGVPCG